MSVGAHLHNMEIAMRHVRMILLALLCVAAGFPMSCATSDVDFPRSHADYLSGSISCAVSLVRYPTEPDDMGDLYNGRGFYADGNHLRPIPLNFGTICPGNKA